MAAIVRMGIPSMQRLIRAESGVHQWDGLPRLDYIEVTEFLDSYFECYQPFISVITCLHMVLRDKYVVVMPGRSMIY